MYSSGLDGSKGDVHRIYRYNESNEHDRYNVMEVIGLPASGSLALVTGLASLRSLAQDARGHRSEPLVLSQ